MTALAPADLPAQRQLAETERWPAAMLRAHQFRQLGLLVEHAISTVPFYRARLAAVGITGGQDLARHWHKLPLLTRLDVQRAGAALRSTEVPPSHGPTHEVSTSGSTAMPVTVVDTALDARFYKALQLRAMLWHGFDFARTFGAIRKFEAAVARYPAGATAPCWGDALVYPFATGPAVMLSLRTSVADQVEWLARQRPAYLMTHPTNLAALIETWTRAAMPAPALAKIVSFAEPLRPDVRTLCRDAWGTEIVDIYSAQEIGYIAVQCPHHEHHHVQAEHVLVEIVDDAGAECAPGAVGRVVVTPLRNFAMPLFRYAIGDHAERGAGCDCGRNLPVIARILGRTRNMLVTPDGQRYWPVLGTGALRTAAPIIQYQYIQVSPDALEARLVVERPLSAAEEDVLRARILGPLPFPFRITFKYVGEIPRRESGKFEDFISEIAT